MIDADRGIDLDNVTQTARGTNGNVETKNINGLDGRLENSIYLKYVFTDSIRTSNQESLTFAWRRSKSKTGTVVTNGTTHHVFEPATHTISVDLTLRKEP